MGSVLSSRCLQELWAPLTDALKVFQNTVADQLLCAQKVWEALLTAFPLDHKHMQTALLTRELVRMMRWDGDNTRAIDLHFSSITELHSTMGFIGDLSIEEVLQSVLLATLRASPNPALRAAYHKVLEANSTVRVITLSTQNCVQAGSQGTRPLPHMNLNVSERLICASRGLGWRIHESVEDTKLSTNKQHTLSLWVCHGQRTV